ncbi:MAG: beta-lactamase family protein [Oscillospiraceae bacterium]|nr:beta-lactamase family protein [Oscillospiraceae bacterium]
MKKILAFLLCVSLILGPTGCGTAEDATGGATGEAVPAQTTEQNHGAGEENIAESPEPDDYEEDPIDHSWQFDAPENRGVDPDGLSRFRAALDEVDIRCAVLVKDGYIIDEYYKDEYDENSVFRMASVTKSVTGAVVGIAIERGLIKEVDSALLEFLPQLNDPGMEDKREITVEHLLTHTSGVYWNEWAGGDYFMRFSRSENWVDFVLDQEMQYAPGAVFNYTTGGSHLLGAVIREATGMTAFDFAKEHMFKPMGMESVEWRADPQGVTDAGNGVSMTARDAAKFGQMFLDGGMYKDRQIIQEEWVERSVSRQVVTGFPNTGDHGYCWWLKSFGGYDAYYAMGHGGQYIIVVPELKLVTVMSSRVSDTYIPQRIFESYLIPACV